MRDTYVFPNQQDQVIVGYIFLADGEKYIHYQVPY